MEYCHFEEFIYDSIVLYRGLGDIDFGGILLDELIDSLKNEYCSPVSVYHETHLLPLICGADGKMHPVFKEDCKYKNPFCFDFEYSPDRLPKSLFKDTALDIFIIDQTIRQGVCHLCFRDDVLCPSGWEVFDDFIIQRVNIIPFIDLARKIQNAKLFELLA